MLKKIRSFFKKNADDSKETAPFTILSACMRDICTQLVNHFSVEHYKWNENEGVKTFECLILSKFLLDHALITTFHGKIVELRTDFYLKMLDSIFKSISDSTFPNIESSDIVMNRLGIYSNILSENPHPRCWQLIAGSCTGIDYYSQKDLFTLTSSSMVLPQLLMAAQDSLKLVIKE